MSTLLVVEDEESILEPLVFLLQKEGFNVIAAKDGQEALEILIPRHGQLRSRTSSRRDNTRQPAGVRMGPQDAVHLVARDVAPDGADAVKLLRGPAETLRNSIPISNKDTLPEGLRAYFVHSPIHSRNVLYHSTLFCGFSTQWPSSGKSNSFDGTFCNCSDVNNCKIGRALV